MSDPTPPPPIITHPSSPMDVAEILLSGFHFDCDFVKDTAVSGSSSSNEDDLKSCTHCATTDTPLWRKGPGDKRLCNRCGVYWKRHGTLPPLRQLREIEKTGRQNSPVGKVKAKNQPSKTALKKIAVIVKENTINRSPGSPLGKAAVDFTDK
jgi:hypothetical protein